MDPITIIALLQGLTQLGAGVSQQIAGVRAREEAIHLSENRPKYQTPEEALRALTLISQGFADPRMAGQGRLEDLTGLNQANTIQAGVQSGNPFAVLSASQGRADLTSQEIQTRAMQQQEQERLNLAQALNTVAGFKDQEWQMNEFAPWRDKYQFALNEYRDNLSAGGRNAMTGLDSIGAAGLGYMSEYGSADVDWDALSKLGSSGATAPGSFGNFITHPR